MTTVERADVARASGGLPLLGHLLDLRFRPLPFFRSLSDSGDVVTFRMGTRTAYFISDPRLIRNVYTTQYPSFGKGGPLWDAVRTVLGNGLVTSGGEKHRRQRRLMQPAFHRPRIAEYATVMSEDAIGTMDSWRDGQVLDVGQEMSSLTMLTATRTLFSSVTDPAVRRQIDESFKVMNRMTGWRTRVPIKFLHQLPLPANRRFAEEIQRYHDLVRGIIAEYRAAGVQRNDLLSMLLAARDQDTGQAMTDEQILDECTTLLAAAIDTTGCTLSWLWYILDIRPDLEERLHAEIDTVLAGRPATWEDYPKLQYVQRLVQETLRLYPPLWLTTRSAAEDVELGGHHIPAGSAVFFSAYAQHRNPEIFPDPDSFDPDRWLPERCGPEQREAHIPFGGGIRQCIGMHYGQVEVAIMISTMAGRWRLRVVGKHPEPETRAILWPKPLTMVCEPR